MRAWTSPFCTFRFTPLRMGFSSTETWRFLISSSGTLAMISSRGRELLLVDLDALAEDREGEEGALEAHGADGDAEHLDDLVAVDRLDLGEGLALDAGGEEARAGLRDGAAAAGELHVADLVLVVHVERETDLVAAEGVVGLVVDGRGLEHAEVARVLVVVEDVLAGGRSPRGVRGGAPGDPVLDSVCHSWNTFLACSKAATKASTSAGVL